MNFQLVQTLRRSCRELTSIAVVAVIPSVVSYVLAPEGFFPEQGLRVLRVTSDVVRTWSEPLLWVDSRSFDAYMTQHIPGALNLTLANWDEQIPVFIENCRSRQRIVVYCGVHELIEAEKIARRLVDKFQFSNISVLTDNWIEWRYVQ